jgi:hypothetical protein
MMFRYTLLWSVFLLLFCLSSTLIFSDQPTTILTTVVIETFEEDPNRGWGEATTRWFARGSKFTTREYAENTDEVIGIYPKTASVEAYPTALFGIKSDKNEFGEPRKVLGIMGKFDRKGYNYVEIIPGKPADANTKEEDIIYEDINTGTKWVHSPITIPGRVNHFDIWVWGSNYDYYLDAHFQDYRGMVHSFRMGDLKYAGWRLLRVVVPGSIPQSEPYIPRFKPLLFTKFVIWSRPHERVSGFYVYFDEMKVLTDIYEGRFDGDDLADLETTKEIWGSESQ